MIVNVTQDDIDRGRRKSAQRCPVAVALCRQFDLTPEEISVGNSIVNFETEVYVLPKEAAMWVSDFDAKRSVEPFAFELSKQWFTPEQVTS